MEEQTQTPSMNSCITKLLNSNTHPKEFFNFSKTSIPATWDIARNRAFYNLNKFRTYYSFTVILFTFIFILFKPSVIFLIMIGGLSVYCNINTPTVNGFKFTRGVTVGITAGLLIVFSIFFSSVIVSVLALISFLGLGIITHSISLEEDEVHEDI
jgi:hypothetical protein